MIDSLVQFSVESKSKIEISGVEYMLDFCLVRCMYFDTKSTVEDITKNEASSRSYQLPVRIKHRIKNLGIRKT